MVTRHAGYVALLVLIVAGGMTASLFGANGNFVPDWTFKGSSLTEWQMLGSADWRAENGEIVGTPKTAEGGWLVLNQSFQDVQVAASLRCAAACKAGVLLRAEKTPEGMKGILVSYTPGDIAAYAVKLDAQGHEVEPRKNPGRRRTGAFRGERRRDPAERRAGGRGAGAAARCQHLEARRAARRICRRRTRWSRRWPGRSRCRTGRRRRRRGRAGMPEGYTNPYTTPTFEFKPTDWNNVEVEVEANLLRGWLNGGPEAGAANGAADEELGRYGPVALYVGGAGEVRFKDIAFKDLGRRVTAAGAGVARASRCSALSNFTTAWSASAADINRDGILDVVAGPVYFLGPDFTVMREITLSQTVNPEQRLRRARWCTTRTTGPATAGPTCSSARRSTSIPARNCDDGTACRPACSPAAKSPCTRTSTATARSTSSTAARRACRIRIRIRRTRSASGFP